MKTNKWYDVTWVTRKGYKHNQYGQEWHMIAIAHSKKEARELFDEWWYSNHDYHAFGIEITTHGKELYFVHECCVKHLDRILERRSQ